MTITSVALLAIPPPQFKLFMDSIIWAIKHTMRDIADTGLNSQWINRFLARSRLICIAVCFELVNNFADSDPGIANAFYQQYLLSTLQDILFVLSDSDHKSGKCILITYHSSYWSLVIHHRFQVAKCSTCTSSSVGRGGPGPTTII